MFFKIGSSVNVQFNSQYSYHAVKSCFDLSVQNGLTVQDRYTCSRALFTKCAAPLGAGGLGACSPGFFFRFNSTCILME